MLLILKYVSIKKVLNAGKYPCEFYTIIFILLDYYYLGINV